MLKTTRSEKIYNQLCEVIPGGVNSPVRSCQAMGQLPLVAERGVGDTLFDPDGNKYIDFCCAWGSLIHGHAHPVILDAIEKRARMGSSFGITTEIEEKLARKIVGLIDSIDLIRFVNSGTEATMSAARLARGYTGRPIIIKFTGNYHGHADFFLVKAGSGVLGLSKSSSSEGIPSDIVKHVVSLNYNDIDQFKKLISQYNEQVAAVILEPIAGNMGVVPSKIEFLKMLRKETEKIGALLIFDEVINGFRVGLYGAQGLYDITPDLTCYAKIIGGGFPVAAFGGRRDVMEYLAPLGPVYQAGTLSGNPVAMEAGYQALQLLEVPGIYEELQTKTDQFLEPIAKVIQGCVQQVGSMFTLFFKKEKVENMEDAKEIDQETYAQLFRYLFQNGVYIPPSPHEAWFISCAHTDENLEKAQKLILQFCNVVA